MTEIQRCRRHRQHVDAVDHLRSSAEPRCVGAAVTPHHADRIMSESIWEHIRILVMPVLLHCGCLRREKVDTEVSGIAIAGYFAPQHKRLREVHRLRRRLLVVAREEAPGATRPTVPRVRVEVSQERVLRIAAIHGSSITNELVDHSAIAIIRCPRRIVLGDGRRGIDPVAPVEMVVVEFRLRPVTRRVADHRSPVFVVVEDPTRLPRSCGEPISDSRFDRVEKDVTFDCHAELVGDLS